MEQSKTKNSQKSQISDDLAERLKTKKRMLKDDAEQIIEICWPSLVIGVLAVLWLISAVWFFESCRF